MNGENKIEITGIMKDGYGIIPKMIMKDKDLSIEAKSIYSFMASYSGAGNTSFPSVEFITDHLGISRKRFNRHRKMLENKGYITISQENKGGEFKSNVYTLELIPKVQNGTTQNRTTQNGATQFDPSITNSSSSLTASINNSFHDNEQSDQIEYDFVDFWELYGKKLDRPKAERAFKKAYKKHGYQKIKEGTELYKQTVTNTQFQKYPATFLNNESYLDVEAFKDEIKHMKNNNQQHTPSHMSPEQQEQIRNLPF